MLRLAEVGADRLAELVTDAWRMRAPRDLAAQFAQTPLPDAAGSLATSALSRTRTAGA